MKTKPRHSVAKQRQQPRNQADESCMMDHYREELSATVAEHPLSTTLGVFAIGLTLGVAVGAAFGTAHRSDRRKLAESFGRRVLDSLHDYVPESMHQYLHG